MPGQNYTRTILKNLLDCLSSHPTFARTALCNPAALRSLVPEQCRSLVDTAPSPVEQTIKILQCVMVQLFVESMQRGNVSRARGVLLFWYTYLDPSRMGAQQQLTVADAALICTKDEVRAFLDTYVAPFAKMMQDTPLFTESPKPSWLTDGSPSLCMAPSPQQAGKIYFARLNDNTRRTYANYIYKTLDFLAKTITRVLPTALTNGPMQGDETPSIGQASTTPSFDPYIERVTASTAQLPTAFGYTPSAEQYIVREVLVDAYIGQSTAPTITVETLANLPHMSGVLAGEAGSGRTSYLQTVQRSLALLYQAKVTPVIPIYVRAPEFLPHAEAQRTLYEFAAPRIFEGAAGQMMEWIQVLKMLEADGKLFWLVDDLDHLTNNEQITVLKYLAFCRNVLIGVLPWQIEATCQPLCIESAGRQHFGRYHLLDLNAARQEKMMSVFTSDTPGFNWTLGKLAIQESPVLACLPLGVASICRHVTDHQSNPAQVGVDLLNELFTRDKIDIRLSVQSVEDIRVRSLLQMVTQSCVWVENWAVLASISTLKPVERNDSLKPYEAPVWEILRRSRLIQMAPNGRALQFSSRVLIYLFALSQFHIYLSNCPAPENGIGREIDELASCLWEWNCLMKNGVIGP